MSKFIGYTALCGCPGAIIYTTIRECPKDAYRNHLYYSLVTQMSKMKKKPTNWQLRFTVVSISLC